MNNAVYDFPGTAARLIGYRCHECQRIKPAMWGCREHWFKLPKPLRDQVWREYRPGQEITKTPSVRYLAVAALVQGWIAGKVTINRDGSIFVHEDLQVIAERVVAEGKNAVEGE